MEKQIGTKWFYDFKWMPIPNNKRLKTQQIKVPDDLWDKINQLKMSGWEVTSFEINVIMKKKKK